MEEVIFFSFFFEARSLAVPFRTTFIKDFPKKSPCFQALEARRED